MLRSLALVLALLMAPTASFAGERPIDTQYGKTRRVETPMGARHVAVNSFSDGSQRYRDYQIVTRGSGGLSFQAFGDVETPYGTAKATLRDGRLDRTIVVAGKRFSVREGDSGRITYVDAAGKAYKDAPRANGVLLTEKGPAPKLKTANGVKEVVAEREGSGKRATVRYYETSVQSDQVYLEELSPVSTTVGETVLKVRGDRLVSELTVDGHAFEVTERKDGTPVFTAKDGTQSIGAPRIGDSLVTEHGRSRPLSVKGKKIDVVVEGKGENATYQQVVPGYGGFSLEEVERLETPFGPARIVQKGKALAYVVDIEGRTYSIEERDGEMKYLGRDGKPYRDLWREKVARGGTPATSLKNPYNASLRALTPGTIVTIQGNPHMAQAAYDDLRDAMIEALKLYDPRTTYFIGLGSDPHPLIAFLQNLGGKDLAINFPASGKYYEGVAPEVLEPYARELLPPEVLSGKKTLVLVDQTNSGATLKQLTPSFRKFLKSIGSPAKVEALAFSPQQQPRGTRRIDTNKHPEVSKFLYAPYEHIVSQYDRHVLGSDTLEDLVERPQYDKFKDAMYKRMQRDPKLSAFLSKSFRLRPEARADGE